jgi:hypothetical protein
VDLQPSVGLDAQTAYANAGSAREVALGTASPWSTGSLAEAPQSGPTSVSCPVANFCMAIDEFGNVVTYNGTTWSAPMQADPKVATYPPMSPVSPQAFVWS